MEAKIVINAELNDIEYAYFKEQGYDDKWIIDHIKEGFNSAKIVNRFVSDFEVESVEVKS
jgi:hypothetical protein